VTPRTIGPAVRDVRLGRGNTFVWKPTVASADGQHSYTWAGCIVVGDSGAEALPKRPVDIISIT
jgi:hypothetical protein